MAILPVARVLGGTHTLGIFDEDAIRLQLAVVRIAEQLARETGRPIRWPPEVAEHVHTLEVLAANAERNLIGTDATALTWEGSAGGSAAPEVEQASDMLTSKQLAEVLGISDRAVRKRAKALGGVKVDGHWSFPSTTTDEEVVA